MIEGILLLAVCFVGMILYYRAKNNWKENHQKQCSFCGKMYPETYALKDGCICDSCCRVTYRGGTADLSLLMSNMNLRLCTVNEIRNYINTIKERGELMASFNPTRVSPSGKIKVDDSLGLFVITGQSGSRFAHRVADIESFKLVIDKDNYGDTPLVEGGHIAIKINEPIKEIQLEMGVQDKLVGMKHEVKKTFEDDLEFLEQITGMKRKMTSDFL